MAKKKAKLRTDSPNVNAPPTYERPPMPPGLREPLEDRVVEMRLPAKLATDIGLIALRSGTTAEDVIRVLLGLYARV